MAVSQTTMIQAPGVNRKIGLAWAALAWENLWPRLMPLLALAALFIAAAHLDLFAGLDPWVHTGLLAALALAFAGLGWWQMRDFAWPTQEAAVRRLERDSEVPHRPLVAVQDHLATGADDSIDRKSTRLNSSHFPYTTLFRSSTSSPVSIPGSIRVCWPRWRWPLPGLAGGRCATSPGPRRKRPCAGWSATARCRTVRWSPFRTTWPLARTIP